MSTIYFDPVTMDATAGAIGEHADEVGSLIDDLETSCSAEVPPSLAGWLADELHDIVVHAKLAQVLYVVAALDTAVRAQQIQTDQSLATAATAPGATALAESPVVGGFVLGVTEPTAWTPVVGTDAPGSGWLLGLPGGPDVGNPPLISGGLTNNNLTFADIPDDNYMDRLLLSTPGRTALGDGLYRGSGMTGSFHSVLPDPGEDY